MRKNNFVLIFICSISFTFCYPQSRENKAFLDTEFENGSKITSIQLSEDIVESLTILGQVWGFLKYNHPSIAKGNYNWDYELFRILPQVYNKNKTARNKLLLKWINTLGRFENGNYNTIDSSLIKLHPDYSWIKSVSLGIETEKKLISIKNSKHETEHFYIAFDSLFPHPEFKNENSYEKEPFPDTGFRLLSLFRYWNIIQYYFPYRHLIKEDWNIILKEFIPKFINASNELEYKLAVLALISKIHDSHAVIESFEETIENFRGQNIAPIEISFIEEKAVVTDYLDEESGRLSGLQKGDVLKFIDNKDIQTLIEEKAQIISASNRATLLRDIAWDLLRTNKIFLDIKYVRKNIAKEIRINCYSLNQINRYKRLQREDTCFKMLNPDVAYLYPWTIKSEYLETIMAHVSSTKGLIIDLRYTPRESLYKLGDYIMPAKTIFAKLTKGSLTNPGQFIFYKDMDIGKINKNYYKGKIVILNNEYTQSSSEFTSIAMRAAPNSTVIGSSTAGADGSVSQFYLPGGILTRITGSGVYYPNGAETQQTGIKPDIEIKPTIKGILENKDELLDKSIEYISN